MNDSDTDILLATEGTYPFAVGGVSVWADQLVRGLPERRFTLYAVVANPYAVLRYRLPPNVEAVWTVPLWGTESHAEYGRHPGWWARPRRGGDAVRRRFLPAYEALLHALLEPAAAAYADAETALLDLADVAAAGALRAALRRPAVWRLFRDRLLTHPLFRHLSTLEAVDLGRLFYRYLAPLAYPAPAPSGPCLRRRLQRPAPDRAQATVGGTPPADRARGLLPGTAAGPGPAGGHHALPLLPGGPLWPGGAPGLPGGRPHRPRSPLQPGLGGSAGGGPRPHPPRPQRRGPGPVPHPAPGRQRDGPADAGAGGPPRSPEGPAYRPAGPVPAAEAGGGGTGPGRHPPHLLGPGKRPGLRPLLPPAGGGAGARGPGHLCRSHRGRGSRPQPGGHCPAVQHLGRFSPSPPSKP
ncbi:protein of unknown function [Candidatus Hydrogenisulfobacillus filiaventi]|uniref:DUF3492 domain-containing protein n=1 Tax=Candidatus Hydrogenisulfobacillus filiaventi TaxID=2707344 RepID=A0A6F8ZE80_9FIRM|nr:protein of unknown function [Candidatus Hydrogenisulfobacillus filiaventi]